MGMRYLSALGALPLVWLCGCVPTAPERGAPCPCNEGYRCCPAPDTCVPINEACPGTSTLGDCAPTPHASSACDSGAGSISTHHR